MKFISLQVANGPFGADVRDIYLQHKTATSTFYYENAENSNYSLINFIYKVCNYCKTCTNLEYLVDYIALTPKKRCL